MKKFNLILAALIVFGAAAFADEVAAPAPATAPVTAPAEEPKAATWDELLQKKYSLTEAELKSLNDAKISDSQQAMAARLARSSGKTVDEVLKMRLEDKMGWGKIAKTLGVPPGELGKAVSEMNKERNAARKTEFTEKRRLKREARDAARKIRNDARAANRRKDK